ncbi:N-acetyllactosaminide beta-1,3-N-acetylglucosaminyltransferase 2 [Hippoglossus hippoglossus]|uniref:N-acetyllactosaminide beta-1,3-N-acetylglucosaminyltransferase 2 n=1 Tax=Hippoglossus hippoglossus TaxID=8267 RepID=UPI00148E75CC|nr:N-acetyllactosaminide beta-1,3-N-acetylglucosaminyltransferase 2 [Hippoglossus hippoglossus]
MARCHCRWYKVVFCLCSPCICLLLFLLCIYVMLGIKMTNSSFNMSPTGAHFVASGTFRNAGFAPMPRTFWAQPSQVKALWNHLQLVSERQYNPILRPHNSKVRFDTESLVWEGFSEVTDLENGISNFGGQPQLMKEFVSHMQQRDFPILIQPDGICGAGAKNEKKRPLLLMAIKSSELNLRNRHAIRQTWGRAGWVAGHSRNRSRGEEIGGYVHRVFLLGRESPEDLGVDVSELLQTESKLYGDILQWDFKDTFFNLTLKDVLFWNWFSRVCGPIHFVFKGDDDIFINTMKLITYLQDQLNKPQAHKTMKDFMVGQVINVSLPIRASNSKYFIPDSFYKGLYPPYASGGGVVYSGLLTRRLHKMSKRVHLFPIDDVYVGMCMDRLNTSPIHHPAFLMFGFDEKEEKEPCLYHRILLVHKRSPIEMVNLWVYMKKTQIQCWDVPLRETGQGQGT